MDHTKVGWILCWRLNFQSALENVEIFKALDKVKTLTLQALSMINELIESFTHILHQSGWMDGETRMFARQKVEAIGKKIGYPEFILDDRELEQYYDMVSSCFRWYGMAQWSLGSSVVLVSTTPN